MSDLVKRLRIKAGMIEMGEMIAWGSDTALMREAADALEMAAPAVQGEPVAYLRQDQIRQVQRMGPMFGEIANSPRVDRVPVYTAQKPAERKPSTHWSHDNPGLADQYRAEAMAARRSVGFEQDADDVAPADIVAAIESLTQPATESALLEAFVAQTAAQAAAAELAAALESMIQGADRASWDGYFPADTVTRAVEALAAYRNQGGEQ